jgi:hypothetical protein
MFPEDAEEVKIMKIKPRDSCASLDFLRVQPAKDDEHEMSEEEEDSMYDDLFPTKDSDFPQLNVASAPTITNLGRDDHNISHVEIEMVSQHYGHSHPFSRFGSSKYTQLDLIAGDNDFTKIEEDMKNDDSEDKSKFDLRL